MKAITWEKLPPTFRDAMKICMELDVQYIWIDSLCIVQDDDKDWKVEAHKMGKIYENAYFTIAATSAQDSSQGLFGQRKPLDIVELLYERVEGNKSQVFAYIEPQVEKEMGLSPLSQRAWVLQEYLLARRTVHFTKHGLVWTCKNQERSSIRHITSEFGEVWATIFEDTWTALVGSYTRRQLTVNTDKLVAIAGLSLKFEERRPGRTYRQGLWLEDMPHDLLWFSNERLTRDASPESNIPSWSWASTAGPISFKSSEFDKVDSLCHRIHCPAVTKDRLLINTTLKLVDDLLGPLQCQAFCYEDLQDMDFNGRLHDTYRDGSIQPSPTFLLLSGGQKVGWAVFDDFERPPEAVYCLGLLRQKLGEWHAMSKEKEFIWALLLRKQRRSYGREAEEFFNRVGWGIVLVPSWLEQEKPQDVWLM
jgi:Heterokaryon incompatibility protein (HET)